MAAKDPNFLTFLIHMDTYEIPFPERFEVHPELARGLTLIWPVNMFFSKSRWINKWMLPSEVASERGCECSMTVDPD